MGILDSMTQQAQPQQAMQGQPMQQNTQGQPQGGMAQMYQMLMENSMNAIAGVAQERIEQKGPIEGIADLVAKAMISNLQAAQQNEKTIPPQVMMQVAKDLAMNLLQQIGVPEDQIDDVLIDILMGALDEFGEATNGILPPEEEQQYVDMINKVAELENQRQAQMQGDNQQPMQQGA
ncbi:hypothetical protein HYE54_01055 [Aggregatibacter actinomycetemcomitans]|uniref:hypothetical protein n=1 Tax=Aggregatibacter actinomycetemcomitans TaxID=714 RepID=UPI00197BAF9F|nr:hypothetical protein [Aggregatibacter actinomycetemcomitans]MBN6067406.1 hypothetical protein [Aggregatibacter actinomycetemcomitans]MBN6086092.1 hypothetical protein [Aggregatibacter actinomycetemcomitans]